MRRLTIFALSTLLLLSAGAATAQAPSPCLSSNGQVCSAHGTCVTNPAGQYCACFVGYEGFQCQRVAAPSTSCTAGAMNGVPCSGHGTCQETSSPSCVCATDFIGPQCQFLANQANACIAPSGQVCNEHGTCMSTSAGEYCACYLNFTGAQCQTPVKGISRVLTMTVTVTRMLTETTSDNVGGDCLGSNGPACSGNGNCVSGECDCSNGYYGQYCQYFASACVNATNGMVCSGNGRCSVSSTGAATCTCFLGYAGFTCETPVTNMPVPVPVPTTTSNCTVNASGAVCSSNGICYNGVCACNPGFYGQYCQFEHNATNSCTGPNGLLCSGQGTCMPAPNGDFLCVCTAPWAGRFCTVNATQCTSANGVVCSGHGQCVSNGSSAVCLCYAGWAGLTCQSAASRALTMTVTVTRMLTETTSDNVGGCLGSNGAACSGNGNCVNGECDCSNGYYGQYCQYYASACVNATNGMVCSGNGQCSVSSSGAATCTCFLGYAGSMCETPVTNMPVPVPVPTTTSNCTADSNGAVCSGNGICLNGACGCAEGYIGQFCQYRETPIPAPSCSNASPNGVVCSGHGQCTLFVGVMQCKCAVGWVGAQCEAPFPTDTPVTTTGLPQQAVGSAAEDTTASLPKTIGIAAVVAAVVALLVLGVGVLLLRKRRGASAQPPREEGKFTVAFIAADDSPACEMTPNRIGDPNLV